MLLRSITKSTSHEKSADAEAMYVGNAPAEHYKYYKNRMIVVDAWSAVRDTAVIREGENCV